jgi:hypothetical protein
LMVGVEDADLVCGGAGRGGVAGEEGFELVVEVADLSGIEDAAARHAAAKRHGQKMLRLNTK